MKSNNYNISLEDAFKISDFENTMYKRRDNGLILSNYQIDVLMKNGIDYNNYNNLSDILFDIELILEQRMDEQLDNVGYQISEIIYYHDTNK